MSAPLILPHIKSGWVKAIAVGGERRPTQLSDVPTLGKLIRDNGIKVE